MPSGIDRSASSESAAIVGTIMIARMIQAVNAPNPSEPVNSETIDRSKMMPKKP